MARHRESAYTAAHGYAALFRGETTHAAIAASMRLHVAIENYLAYLTALSKAGSRRRG